jgi:hypothetical protein
VGLLNLPCVCGCAFIFKSTYLCNSTFYFFKYFVHIYNMYCLKDLIFASFGNMYGPCFSSLLLMLTVLMDIDYGFALVTQSGAVVTLNWDFHPQKDLLLLVAGLSLPGTTVAQAMHGYCHHTAINILLR